MQCNLALTCSQYFPLQMYLNHLANYVPNTWNYEHGCSHCDDDILDLSQLKVRAIKFNHFPSICFVDFESAAVETVYQSTSLWAQESIKYVLVFQHDPSIYQ